MEINYYGTNNFMGYCDIADHGNNTDQAVKIDSMVCPCCGKRLRLVDSCKAGLDNEDAYTVTESTALNENKLADYLLEIIEAEARNIYEDELESNAPEIDDGGNIVNDYGERFISVSKELKKIIKMKANMISNLVKQQGIEISPYYIENELFQVLKTYGYIGKQNI